MIRKVLYKDIDFEKYEQCIQASYNYKVYAEAWYLNIHTANQWDCIVFNDYEAVMPLPYIKKFGIKVISQPIYCQQLGIFSFKVINAYIFNQFVSIITGMKILSYQFNEENNLYNISQLKNNFLLDLNQSYEVLRSHYRRDRKKDIQRISKLNLEINSEIDVEIFLDELNSKYPSFSKYYKEEWFRKLLIELIDRGLYTFYELKDKGVIISSIFVVHSKSRRILLLSSRSEDSKYKGAFAFLVNYFIQKNSNTDLVLDFEGSMLSSIADFNESFGSRMIKYPAIMQTKKNIVKKALRLT